MQWPLTCLVTLSRLSLHRAPAEPGHRALLWHPLFTSPWNVKLVQNCNDLLPFATKILEYAWHKPCSENTWLSEWPRALAFLLSLILRKRADVSPSAVWESLINHSSTTGGFTSDNPLCSPLLAMATVTFRKQQAVEKQHDVTARRMGKASRSQEWLDVSSIVLRKRMGCVPWEPLRDEVLEENGEIGLEGDGYKEQLGVWQPSIPDWHGISVFSLFSSVSSTPFSLLLSPLTGASLWRRLCVSRFMKAVVLLP